MNMLDRFFNGVRWVIFLAFVVIGLLFGFWYSDYVNTTRKFYEEFPEWKQQERLSDSLDVVLKDFRYRLDSTRKVTVFKMMGRKQK